MQMVAQRHFRLLDALYIAFKLRNQYLVKPYNLRVILRVIRCRCDHFGFD